MLSKTPLIKLKSLTISMISPPMKLAQSHARAEIIIPCLRRIFLMEYLSNTLIQRAPAPIDKKLGIKNPIKLNSKYIISTIIGIRHINPIPIIIIPEFLATINKSVLLIYLIVLILIKILYKFISIKKIKLIISYG